jgi:phospholipid/cholesterol/gamma-HCH transport system permease protein
MTDGTGLPRSLSATGGILLGPRYHFRPDPPRHRPLRRPPFEAASPSSTLSLPVIQTREVEPGETVGYACTWVAERPSIIATLAAGYADGLPRTLSNRAQLWDGDRACPLVGRVSMDMITVDMTDLPEIPRSWTFWVRTGVDVLADIRRNHRLRAADGAWPALHRALPGASGMIAATLGGLGRPVLQAWLPWAGWRSSPAPSSAICRPPFYLRELGTSMLQIGWFSLPVVGLTAIFTGGALALQIYAGGSRFNAEAVVPSIVAIGMTRELGPVLGGLMVAARVASLHRGRDRHDEGDRTDRRPGHPVHQPAEIPGRSARGRGHAVDAGAGRHGRCHRDHGRLAGRDHAAGFQLGHLPEEHRRFPAGWDVGSGLVKGAVFGFIVALMGCYHGMNSARGAQGVGAATKAAVVSASRADPGRQLCPDRSVLLVMIDASGCSQGGSATTGCCRG